MRLTNSTLTKDWVKLHSSAQNHKKMYKAKKQWVVASATLIALAGMGAVAGVSINADSGSGSAQAMTTGNNSNKAKADNPLLNSNKKLANAKVSLNVNNNSNNSSTIASNKNTTNNNNDNSTNSNNQDNAKLTANQNNKVSNGTNTTANNNLNNSNTNDKFNANKNGSNDFNASNRHILNANSKAINNIQNINLKQNLGSSQANKLNNIGNTNKANNNGTNAIVNNANIDNISQKINNTRNAFAKVKPLNFSQRALGKNHLNNVIQNNLIRNNPFINLYNSFNTLSNKVIFNMRYCLNGNPNDVVFNNMMGIYTNEKGPMVMYSSQGLASAPPYHMSGYTVDKSTSPVYTSANDGQLINWDIPVTANPGHIPGKFMHVYLVLRDYGTDKLLSNNPIEMSFNTDQLKSPSPEDSTSASTINKINKGHWDWNDGTVPSNLNNYYNIGDLTGAQKTGPETSTMYWGAVLTVANNIVSKDLVNPSVVNATSNDIFANYGDANHYDQQHADFDSLQDGKVYTMWLNNSINQYVIPVRYVDENGYDIKDFAYQLNPGDVDKKVSDLVNESVLYSNAPMGNGLVIDTTKFNAKNPHYSDTIQPNTNGPMVTVVMKSDASNVTVPIKFEGENSNGQDTGPISTGNYTINNGLIGTKKNISSSTPQIAGTISSLEGQGYQLDSSKNSSYSIKLTGANSYSLNGSPGGTMVFYLKNNNGSVTVPIDIEGENYDKQDTGSVGNGSMTVNGSIGSPKTVNTSSPTISSLISQLSSQGYQLDTGKTTSYTVNLTGNSSYTANGTPSGTLKFYVYDTKANVSVPFKVEKENSSKQDTGTAGTGTIGENGTVGQTAMIDTTNSTVAPIINALAGQGYKLDTSKPGAFAVKYTDNNKYTANGTPNGTLTFYMYDNRANVNIPFQVIKENYNGQPEGQAGSGTINSRGTLGSIITIDSTNPKVSDIISSLEGQGYTLDESKIPSYSVKYTGNTTYSETNSPNFSPISNGTLKFYVYDNRSSIKVPIIVKKENYDKQDKGQIATATVKKNGTIGQSFTITPSDSSIVNVVNSYEGNGYKIDYDKPEAFTIKYNNNSSYSMDGEQGGTPTFYLYDTNSKVKVPVRFEKENYKKQDEGQFPSTAKQVQESGTVGQTKGLSADDPSVSSVIQNIESQGFLLDPSKTSNYEIKLTDNGAYAVNGKPSGTVTFYLYDDKATDKTNVYYQTEDTDENPIGSKVKLGTVTNTGMIGSRIPRITPPNPNSIPALSGKGYSLDENNLPDPMPVIEGGGSTSPNSVTFYYYQTRINNRVQVYYQRDGQDSQPVKANAYAVSVEPTDNGTASVQVLPPSSPALQHWTLTSPSVITKTFSANTPSPIKVVFHYEYGDVSNVLNIQTEEKHADGSITPGPKYTKPFTKASLKSPEKTVSGADYVPPTADGISWSLDSSNPKYPAIEQVKVTKGTTTDPGTVYFLYDENKVQPDITIQRIEETSPGHMNPSSSFSPYVDSNQYTDGQDVEYDGNVLNPDPNDYQLDTQTGPSDIWAKVNGDSYEPDGSKGTKALKLYYTPIVHKQAVQPVNATVEVTIYSESNPADGNPPVPVDTVPVDVSLMPGQTATLTADQPRFADDIGLQPGSTPAPDNPTIVISRKGNKISQYTANFYYKEPYQKNQKPTAKTLQPIQFTYTDGTNTWKSPVIHPADEYDDPHQVDADDEFPTELVGYYHIKDAVSAGFTNRFQEIPVPIVKSLFGEDLSVNLNEEDTNGHTIKVVPASPYNVGEHQGDSHTFKAGSYIDLVPGFEPDPNHESRIKVVFGPGDNNASLKAVNLYYRPKTESIPVAFDNVLDGGANVGNGTARYKFGTHYTTEDAGNEVGVPVGYVLVPKQLDEHVAGDTDSKDIPGNSTVTANVAPEACQPIHVKYLDQNGNLLGSTDVSGKRFTWQSATQLGNDGWEQTVIPDTYYVVPGQNKEYQFGPDSGKTVDVEAVGRMKNINYHIKRYLEAPDGELISEDSPIEVPAQMQYGSSKTFNINNYPVPGFSPDSYHNGTATVTLHEDGHSSISNDAFYYRADWSGTNQVQPVTVNYLTSDGKVLLSKVLHGYMGQRINVTDEDTVPKGYQLDSDQQVEHTFSQKPAKPMNLYVSAIPVQTKVTNNHQYRKVDTGTTIDSPHYISHDTYISGRNERTSRVRHHFKWFWVIKTLRIHTSLKFNNHNYFKVVHPRDHFTFKILKICRFHHKVRYMIRFHHRIGYVTANRRWTRNAYYSKQDLKRFHGRKHYIKFYHSTDFIHRQTRFTRWTRRIRKNTIMRIYGVKHIGPKYGGMTRFILGDGKYVTSNKNYVKIIK